MEAIKRRNWTREETILALDLYYRQYPDGIRPTNKNVISLAKLLDRSPNSIKAKMFNLQFHDPKAHDDNRKGMPNGSKLDAEIYNEFKDNLSALAYQALAIKASLMHKLPEELLEQEYQETLPRGTTKEQTIRARIGQDFFRAAVLNTYGYKCCITGLCQPELLIASHIKPWKDSSEENERTNPRNGLCLNALHDKAFDKGLITVTINYKIIISKALKNAAMDDDTKKWFMSYGGRKISEPEKFKPAKEFLEYHNDVIFKK